LFSQTPYEILLISVDKFGNHCTHGGAFIQAKLHGSNLPPGQETNVEVEDREDGTYALKLLVKSPADLKCLVSVLKEKPVSATAIQDPKNVSEFPPLMLNVTSEKAHQFKLEREARTKGLETPQGTTGATDNTAIASGSGSGKDNAGSMAREAAKEGAPSEAADDTAAAGKRTGTKARRPSMSITDAALEVISGFGAPEERRQRQLFGGAEAVRDAAVGQMRKEVGAKRQAQGQGSSAGGQSNGKSR